MSELAVNNPFGFFTPRNKKSSYLRKENRFETVISPQLNVPNYKESGYFLDPISGFASNQSLNLEQIAESRINALNEKIQALSSSYEINNFEELKLFLSKNRLLISLIEEIPNKIYQYYGRDQKISLEIFYEPDFPQSAELWVSVLTELSAEEARSAMNKFDKEWWLENLSRADCKLNIGIEYV